MLLLVLQGSLLCLASRAAAVTSVQKLKAGSRQGKSAGYLGGLCGGREVVSCGLSHWDCPQEHTKSTGAVMPGCNLLPESILLCPSLSASLCPPAFTCLNPGLLSDCRESPFHVRFQWWGTGFSRSSVSQNKNFVPWLAVCQWQL